MIRRVRLLRLGIFLGYSLLLGGLAVFFIGPDAAVVFPAISVFVGAMVSDWVMAGDYTRRLERGGDLAAQAGMTSETIDAHLRVRGSVVLDDDPTWGKLVEGTTGGFHRRDPLTAVQVTNATPEPDGTRRTFWLRVPARGDVQPPRVCTVCQRDIGFPPRRAREAVAWTFRLCEDHYIPSQAT